MNVVVCILAKDEAHGIARTLTGLVAQTIFKRTDLSVEVQVVANGCSDDTAAVAQACSALFSAHGAIFAVHDLVQGGKSRAWNRAVHEIAGDDTDLFIFCDADIEFIDQNVLEEMLKTLNDHPEVAVCAGYPVKDVRLSKGATAAIDRLSLAISKRTRSVNAISGQLYVARSEELRSVWLPNETPGEDGFLNAMINTHGFTRDRGVVVRGHSRPTHFFESLNLAEFVTHERRLIIGTVINCWIFEYLWSLKLTTPAGPLIEAWNEADPAWVERIIRQRAGGRMWLIPMTIVFGRFHTNRRQAWWKFALYLPLAVAATVLTIAPAILANKRLKTIGAASTW